MFKYDEYPEIKKIYQERERLLKKQRIAGKKIRPDDEASEITWSEVHAALGILEQEKFALLIYNTFKDKKPKLYNNIKDYFAKWEEVIPETWEECDEDARGHLLGLVLEIGYGEYWLPDKYYDDKPLYGCLPAPPTHTKDWGFGFKD